MSLPLATKEISHHPGKNAVTSPTDKAAMQADVDRKMRLYGVIQAFRQNRYPDNAQVDETLEYVLGHSPVDESKLSSDGKKLVSDVRDIIETARTIVKEKNSDELIQNFLFHTAGNVAPLPSADTSVVDADKSTMKRDGQQAVEHLRTLMRLILTNSEARKLLSDASLIGRDLFARGAATAAESVRPDQEQLARVDDAAPSDEFVGAKGERRGVNEPVPDVLTEEQRQQGRRALDTAQQARDVKNYATAQRNDLARDVWNSDDKQGTAMAGVQDRFNEQVPDEHKDRAANVAGGAQGEAQQMRSEVEDAPEGEKGEAAKRSLMGRLTGAKDKIPQEHRDRARDQVNRAKEFLKDEFPEERRDQYIYRLKKVLVECQKHRDYQEALTWFLSAIETYANHTQTLASHHANKAGDVTEDPSFQRATSELRTILERFANGQSVQPIMDNVDRLAEDARNDEGLRNWFKQLDTFVRRALLEPGFVLAPQFNNEANRLRDTGREFFDTKYAGHKDALFDSVQAWFTAFSNDPLNHRFSQDWKRLTKDLLFGADGNLQFKPHLWNDIRRVIVPQLVNHVGYIPIPRIEYTDNSMDLVIENLTMEGTNLLPNIISLDAHNFMEFSPYDSIGTSDSDFHDFTFKFSQMQADMRDVAFWVNRKTGPVKLKDSGLADVFLGGEGLTVKVHLTGAGRDPSSVFKVKDVTVKVDSLKFSVRDTKHDLLYKTLKPLATGLVKKQITKAIVGAVRTGLEYVDEQLVAVRDRYKEARADPDTSTTGALGALFERKASDAASKAESKKEKAGKIQVVSKRDSLLIPEGGHESGWINKVSDRDTAAGLGEGWKSHAFNIVPGSYSPVATSAPSSNAGTMKGKEVMAAPMAGAQK